MSIGILGGGVWGSALARVLSKNKVIIYARDKNIVKSINEHKLNPKLKYSSFNDNVSATDKIHNLQNVEFLFVALPAQNIREVLEKSELNNKNQHVVICSKGIEISSSKFLTEVIKDILPYKSISILSGPSFSNEVSQNLPTAITLATNNKKNFESISNLIDNKNFRVYYSSDIIGIQIGGALKNIYAIAAGITQGLTLGENAKSALITRSFAEMTRFAETFGADKNTLFGLSGLGDLILTCGSSSSRNTQFGIKIASSKYDNFSELLQSQEVTEGYYTVEAVYNIAKNKKIDMPIMEAIYNIIYKRYDLKEEIAKLLSRPLREEKI
ncbi:NAD(P)-dependent glycerol-3-phosphate dehydrogenase [Pelagibacteraceae bacterium]|nr:NAD(P)-dependent glycerol-3-phosphate dehydrogenase [Pelagibacteraceae bacterium]